jgi:hypothetical protein
VATSMSHVISACGEELCWANLEAWTWPPGPWKQGHGFKCQMGLGPNSGGLSHLLEPPLLENGDTSCPQHRPGTEQGRHYSGNPVTENMESSQ